MAITKHVRSVRPWLRRVAIWAVVVLMPVASWTLWDYVEARRLASLVAEIRRRGEPVDTLRPRASVEVDGPRNADHYYSAAAALLDSRDLYGAAGLVKRLDQSDVSRQQSLEMTREFLAQNAEAESLLARATNLEFLGERPGFDYTYRASSYYQLAVLADIRVRERLLADDSAGAAKALVQQLRVAKPLGWGRSGKARDLLAILGSVAIKRAAAETAVILSTPPSEQTLAAMQNALAAADIDSFIADALMAERAFWLQMFWNDINHWYASPPRAFDIPNGPTFYVMRPLIIHRLTAVVTMMSALLVDARRPWPERLQVDAPASDALAASPRLAFLGDTGILGEGGIRYTHKQRTETVGSTLALVRCAVSAIAVERFRQAHTNHLPGSLSDLVPVFLPAVLVDPYSGQGLRYKVGGHGFQVYSVGGNRKDDGGPELYGPSASMREFYNAYGAQTETADLGVAILYSPDIPPALHLGPSAQPPRPQPRVP